MVTSVSETHPKNAPLPMVVTESGIITVLSEVQYANAYEPIVVTEFGISKESS